MSLSFLARCEIPRGKKSPIYKGWLDKPRKKIKKNHNVGLLHGHSGTCCFDIDDLRLAKKVLDRRLLKAGVRWTSGKPNRLKVLFLVPRGYRSKLKTVTLSYGGKVFGQFRCGRSMDVLPPSLHPEGFRYRWIDPEPKTFSDIPILPQKAADTLLTMISSKKGARATKSRPYWIQSFNNFELAAGKSLGEEILRTGGYEPVFGGFRRIGSSNNIAIVEYRDGFYNFSDSPDGLLPGPGPIDFFDCFVVNYCGGDKDKAFKIIHNGEYSERLKKKLDRYYNKNKTGTDPKLVHDDDIGPYLDESILFPKKSIFARMVKYVCTNTQFRHNPDMAFWFTLVFIDWLAGGGYGSVMGNRRMLPLYVFTSGSSSSGKTQTIQTGSDILDLIKDSFGEKVTAYFETKKLIEEVGSAEGLQDFIAHQCQNGTDILFTQDEYGLSEQGTVDNRGRKIRSILLKWKTLSRTEGIKPRLLAKNKDRADAPIRYAIHFNYFTSATDDSLKGVLSDQEVGTGYLQRFIGGKAIVEDRFKVKSIYDATTMGHDKKLIKILRKVIINSGKITGTDRGHKAIPVGLTKKAGKLIDKINRQYALKDDRYSKIVENILPVARVRAILSDPDRPVVRRLHIRWAHAICLCSINYFKWLLNKLNEKDDKGSLLESKLLEGLKSLRATSPKRAVTMTKLYREAGVMNAKVWPAKIKGFTLDSMEKAGIIGKLPGRRAGSFKIYLINYKDSYKL